VARRPSSEDEASVKLIHWRTTSGEEGIRDITRFIKEQDITEGGGTQAILCPTNNEARTFWSLWKKGGCNQKDMSTRFRYLGSEPEFHLVLAACLYFIIDMIANNFDVPLRFNRTAMLALRKAAVGKQTGGDTERRKWSKRVFGQLLNSTFNWALLNNVLERGTKIDMLVNAMIAANREIFTVPTQKAKVFKLFLERYVWEDTLNQVTLLGHRHEHS